MRGVVIELLKVYTNSTRTHSLLPFLCIHVFSHLLTPLLSFSILFVKKRFDPKAKDHCTVDTVIKPFRLVFDPTRKHLVCYSITICSRLGKTIQRPIPSSGMLVLKLLEIVYLAPQTAPHALPWRCLCHRKTTYKGPRRSTPQGEFWVSLVVLQIKLFGFSPSPSFNTCTLVRSLLL